MRILFRHLAVFTLVLLTAASAAAQTVSGDRIRLNTGPCVERSGSGSPEGAVAGNPCDTWKDITTGKKYEKVSGTGTIGWITWTAANTASAIVSRDASGDTALRNLLGAAVYGTSPTTPLTLGGTGGTCATYPTCEAPAFTFDTSLITQRLRTDPAYRSQWFVNTDGAHLNAYNGGGWATLKLEGGPTQISGGGLHVGSTSILDPGLGNSALDGYIGKPGYVSQTTGWRIDGLGAADFRYVYADELHARKFIADLEQALAGLQIIAKSVGQTGAPFTAPAPGSISTLTMKDLPSAANMAIFETGDYVWVRQFARAAGALSITNAYGIVTSYADLADGLQTWQFTRLITNGGTMITGAIIEVDAIVLDVGVPGNGWVETNAIDGLYGINSPYQQVVTWSGNSPIAANQMLRTRLGNLRGVTGVTGEYGLIAGTYAATNGAYLRASNEAFELHGIDMALWNGATKVFSINHLTPYWSMGTPAPTSFSTGTGCWSGLDAGVFKWRCGDVAGGTQYISWNGTQLQVAGNIVVTGTSIDASTVTGVSGATVVSGAARGLLGINSSGNPLLPNVATPSGAGLFLGSDKLGYFAAGAWKTYMDSSGNFYLGGTGGALQWNGTTLTIAATMSGNGASITSITGGNITTGSITATQIAAGTITATQIAAATITATQIAANTITAAKIAAGTITATQIAAGTITGTQIAAGSISASEIAANTITANKLSITDLFSIGATIGGFTIDNVSLSTGAGATRAGIYIGGGGANNQAFWAGAASPAAAPFHVNLDGALFASNATISGSITAASGTVTLNASGITIAQGASTNNQLKFSDGSFIRSSSNVLVVNGTVVVFASPGGSTVQIDDGNSMMFPRTGFSLGGASARWTNLYLAGNAFVAGMAGSGNRSVCVNAAGDLFAGSPGC